MPKSPAEEWDHWIDVEVDAEDAARQHDPDLFSLDEALAAQPPTRFSFVSEEAMELLLFDEDWREFERHNYYAQFQEVP